MCREGLQSRFQSFRLFRSRSNPQRITRSRLLIRTLPLLAFVAAPAHAGIPEFTWGAPSVIDSGVQDVGDSGGRIGEFDFLGDGLWRLVYVKGDDIYLIAGNDLGWSTPTPVSENPAASRIPSIASTGSLLHVVWEDERSGHSEVWTRRYDGVSWTDAECLSCDPLPSRMPAFDGSGGEGGGHGLVVWEDEAEDGTLSIHGRHFEESSGLWSAVEPISESTGNASAPSVAVNGFDDQDLVVWVDDRDGNTEIYSRNYSGFDNQWYGETRATDLPGNCSRPRVAADICCYDLIGLVGFVAFEYDGGTAVESWAVISDFWNDWETPFALSADDGIPSTAPDAAGVKYSPGSCYDFDTNLSFVTWTDQLPGGPEQQFARYAFDSLDVDDPMSLGSVVATGLAARTRSPDAPVLQCWLSANGGLSVRQGLEYNCRVDETTVAPYFYVAPDGGQNEITVTETCRNEPVANAYLEVLFYNGMETHFAVDPFQPLQFTTYTDASGVARFAFRGGGCVTEKRAGDGVIIVRCNPLFSFVGYYTQIKSPDIDGTCSVDQWDLEYVQDRLGTDDFCADLDGSGLVDELDVAIVQAALGDECERTAGLEDDGSDPGGALDPATGAVARLRVAPNPGSDRFELHFGLAAGDRATLRIIDVAGRIVRDLGSSETEQGGLVRLAWDGRDDSGRSLTAGVYFADLRKVSGTRGERATIIITR